MSITLPLRQGTPHCPLGCVPHFYKSLAELAPIGIFYTDAHGQCLYVNPWWCAVTGISIEEARGEGWIRGLHPDDRQRVIAEWYQAAQSNSPFQSEYRMVSSDGKETWVLGQAVAELDVDGTVKGYVGTVTDITEHKQKEVELREMSVALEHAVSGISKLDVEGRYVFANQAYASVTGYTPEHMIGMAWQKTIHPDELEAMIAAYNVMLREGKVETEARGIRPDGSVFYKQLVMISIYNEQHQFIGHHCFMKDITDRKQAELELQQAKETAEVANQAKSLFLANMSHELRTPLNVILGFTQVMSRDRTLNREQQENLKIIHRSGDHLLNLINDILDLSKIETGHTSIEASNIDFIALLYSLRGMFQQKAVLKGIYFNFDIDPILPQYITTDPSKLRQILINLLSNAIKFTKQGSVTLKVKVNQEGEISNFQEPKNLTSPVSLLFEVEDTGIGIPAKDLDLIFNAFVQAEAGKGSTEGTGLGLTISRNLARLMGGNITVSSTVGRGTVFQFALPVRLATGVDTPPEQMNRQVVGLLPGQPQYRILVVDDQQENRLLLVKLLTDLGLEVREATNGQEAIALWQVWQPHLILMDIRMPVLDGYQATKWIREQETSAINAKNQQNQASKIIALTAHASNSDRDLAITMGCDDYISKPFKAEILFDLIAKYLGISYLYAESEASSTNNDLSNNVLTPESLSVMPVTWITQLQQAALLCNEEKVLVVLEQIPPEYESLAAELRQLSQNFEFHRIIQLAQDYVALNQL
jgi:two-component system, sensor histidine kinase and response regulator